MPVTSNFAKLLSQQQTIKSFVKHAEVRDFIGHLEW